MSVARLSFKDLVVFAVGILLAGIIIIPATHAKPVKFQYADAMCICEVTVDDTKVNPDEVKKMYEFLNRGVEMSRTAAFDNTKPPADADKLIRETESMRAKNLARIPPATVLKNTGWKNEREKFVFEAEIQYHLDRANLEYRKTKKLEVLLAPVAGRPIPKGCEKFARALPIAATLLPIAKELGETSCKDNRDVKLCMQKYQADPKDENAIDEVRASVLNFGWHNCVNAQRQAYAAAQAIRGELEKFNLKEKHCECED